MTNNQRLLLQSVCDGDIRRAQQCARVILNGITTKKDERIKNDLLRKLDTKLNLLELPANLQGLLVAENVTNFPENRFILRPGEAKVIEDVLAAAAAAEQLEKMGIKYQPSLLLHGASGGGKTMLARYIAHKENKPFLYVRFSNVVSSYLGSTQSNIAKIFDYVRNSPCVLCFDEIDAVGMARGQENEVGEMNRIVISLMQEMDSLSSEVIIIGTTNRYDRLDPALIRRFTLKHEILLMAKGDIFSLAKKFFDYTGIESDGWIEKWCSENFGEEEAASTVVEKCTKLIVDKIIRTGGIASNG